MTMLVLNLLYALPPLSLLTPTLTPSSFSTLPTYLGSAVDTITENGRLFAEVGGNMAEVVYANGADLAKLSVSGLQEGFYVVGSGNTGEF